MEGPSLRIQRLERVSQLDNGICRGILELLRDIDGWEEHSSQVELMELADRGDTWAWLVTQGPFKREVGFAVVTHLPPVGGAGARLVLDDFAVRDGSEHQRITTLLWQRIDELSATMKLPLTLRVSPGQPGEEDFLAALGIVPDDEGVWSLS